MRRATPLTHITVFLCTKRGQLFNEAEGLNQGEAWYFEMLSRESCANEILPQYLQLLMTTRQIRLNYLNVCIEVKELKINIIYVRQPFSLVWLSKTDTWLLSKGKNHLQVCKTSYDCEKYCEKWVKQSLFPIKEDIQKFNFQELDVNVKERVDIERWWGMMRPERVGGWGGGRLLGKEVTI